MIAIEGENSKRLSQRLGRMPFNRPESTGYAFGIEQYLWSAASAIHKSSNRIYCFGKEGSRPLNRQISIN